jgi:CO/xanthine dehydrogenase FAD-binding subunit
MYWERYQIMSSVEETLQRLAEASGRARIVAGGTDVCVQMREMEVEENPLTLLDISRIDALRQIREGDSHIEIGAAVTMTALAASPIVWENAFALAQGASWVGSPQIRAVATIGGNIVNALPAADTAIPLVALDAEAHILSPEGERVQPVEELFVGVGKSSVNPSREMITHFRIPLCRRPRRASAMQRLTKRKAFSIPQLSSAVFIELDDDQERFTRVRMVAAPLAPTPWRPKAAEAYLVGTPATMTNVNTAAEMARDNARARSSLRAGAGYRKDMTAVLIRRTISEALQQLRTGFENE